MKALSQSASQPLWSRYVSQHHRHFAPKRAISTIALCPEPSCQCRPTPPGLGIDREARLNGSMTGYDEHVVVSTGKSNWTSKIELDPESGPFIYYLKAQFRPPTRSSLGNFAGRYHNPTHNVLITASSFVPTPVPPSWSLFDQTRKKPNPTSKSLEIPSGPISLYLFPSFQYVTLQPAPDEDTYRFLVNQFIKGFVLPDQVHPEYLRLSKDVAMHLQRSYPDRDHVRYSTPVTEIVILICGHGGRDTRCGIMGPLLKGEFEEKLPRFDIETLHNPPSPRRQGQGTHDGGSAKTEPKDTDTNVQKHEAPTKAVEGSKKVARARVGMVSHIGGHKFAGNIIIYIPPNYPFKDRKKHPLAGKGIWYGRVEPWHVEGIIEQTIQKGVIIQELLRGVTAAAKVSSKPDGL